jgi:membrane protease YdiL (CAAX protease family)
MTAAESAADRYWQSITILLTVMIAGSLAASAVRRSKGKVAELERPVATVLAFHERTVAMASASDGGWWARFRGWAIDLSSRPLEVAVAAYGEALPLVSSGSGGERATLALQARRAVALAQLGRTKEARAALAAASAIAPAGPVVARVVDYTVLGSSDPVSEGELVEAIAALAVDGVEAEGWTAAVIRIGFHRRSGHAADAAAAENALRGQAKRLLRRADGLAGIYVLLFSAGLLVIVGARATRRPVFGGNGGAALPPPWTLSDGHAVTVRSLIVGGLVGAGFMALQRLSGIDAGPAATIAAAVPTYLYVQRGLLAPYDLGWSQAFGLRPRGWGMAIAACTLVLVTIDLVIAWLVWAASLGLGWELPWTDRVNETLLLGTSFPVASKLFEFVVGAPLVEEIVFRGVIYGSLRRRLAPVPSALVSAALFAVGHLDALPSTTMLFLGAVVSALVYERSRSLVPCIVAHSVNNALAFSSYVLLR